ncbi:MAG: hypothetical protein ABI441_04310 [Flavobacterium sp.]
MNKLIFYAFLLIPTISFSANPPPPGLPVPPAVPIDPIVYLLAATGLSFGFYIIAKRKKRSN